MKSKSVMKKLFKCDEVGPLKECIGCEIDCGPKKMKLKFAQPVSLQSHEDGFDLPQGKFPKTPGVPGEVLVEGEEHQIEPPAEPKKFRSGAGKLLHMMRFSRPKMMNSVRELSKFGGKATKKHIKAMH